mmetsp:Transcript_22075/g.50457  ORF Transcript_22075/g.50457 Transcript_22075/m.50457 type:complete len:127 (+) Transcript_22075:1366-1746(+)
MLAQASLCQCPCTCHGFRLIFLMVILTAMHSIHHSGGEAGRHSGGETTHRGEAAHCSVGEARAVEADGDIAPTAAMLLKVVGLCPQRDPARPRVQDLKGDRNQGQSPTQFRILNFFQRLGASQLNP